MLRRIGLLFLMMVSAGALWAQDAAPDAPKPFDAGLFIRQTHLHQIAGYTTLTLAAATGTAALAGWEAHPYLGYSTMSSGMVTLALGLTAYHDRLDEIWPHALLMGVAETGWVLNAFVWEPGSLPHRITGVTSLVSLGAAFVAIKLIQGSEK